VRRDILYKAIVFDCDGTLIDSSIMIELIYHGYHKMYPEREKLPYEHFIKCYFSTTDENHQYLGIEKENRALFHDICFGENKQHIMNVKPFENICDVIKVIKKHGYVVGINTSRKKETWAEVEHQIGSEVFSIFDYVVTSDMLTNPKPDPESLFLFEKISNISLKETLYIGDSVFDATCAAYAICDFALANWGIVDAAEIHADYILDTPMKLLQLLELEK
jgi:AHBA synthesis associated protein